MFRFNENMHRFRKGVDFLAMADFDGHELKKCI